MTDIDVASDQLRLLNIFHPHAMGKISAVNGKSTRFVHYTSASAAMKILQTKKFWMRKTSCMNDFMEVEHGLRCLNTAYNGEAGERLKATLNSIFNGIANEIEELFRGWAPILQTDTYIACFSEHADTEDMHGRLSMWRAYSESTGVALVVNNAPFQGGFLPLKVYASPVAYLDDTNFRIEFERVVNRIEENKNFIRQLGWEAVRFHVFNAFKFAALCTKHPGFIEENEWRVIYSPTMEQSVHLKKNIEVIQGAPQPVYKIPLKNIHEEGIGGIEIPEILYRIIIGPTEYSAAIREAFVTLLADAGVEDPENRVWVSGLPLRH